jgi:hypothetical protein
MNLSFKNIFFFCVCFFVIIFDIQKVYASVSKKVVWSIEATINNIPIDLFYYGSNFSFLDFNWQLLENNKINNKRFFVPSQQWVDDYKNFFLLKDSVIDFNKIDPIAKSKNYDSFYYPEVLIYKDGIINLKKEDEIIVKKIYSDLDGEVASLDKEDFNKVMNAYNGRFQITAKINADSFESIRVFLFLNLDKKYLPNEVLQIIRNEGEKILVQGKDKNQQNFFPQKKFYIEYNLIKNNFAYFKQLLLNKYNILLIEFLNYRS